MSKMMPSVTKMMFVVLLLMVAGILGVTAHNSDEKISKVIDEPNVQPFKKSPQCEVLNVRSSGDIHTASEMLKRFWCRYECGVGSSVIDCEEFNYSSKYFKQFNSWVDNTIGLVSFKNLKRSGIDKQEQFSEPLFDYDNGMDYIMQYMGVFLPLLVANIMMVIIAFARINGWHFSAVLIYFATIVLLLFQKDLSVITQVFFGLQGLIMLLIRNVSDTERLAILLNLAVFAGLSAPVVMPGYFTSFISLFLVLIIYLWYVRRAVLDKSHRENIGIVYIFSSFILIHEYIKLGLPHYHTESMVWNVLYSVIEIMLPFGTRINLLSNLVYSGALMRSAFSLHDVDVSIFICMSALFSLFVAFRFLYGWLTIRHMFRNEFSGDAILYGAYSYMIDIGAPIRLIQWLIDGQATHRSVVCDIVSVALTMFELLCGRDWLILRGIFIVYDICAYSGHNIWSTRRLGMSGYELDFQSFQSAASMAAVSITELNRVVRATYRIKDNVTNMAGVGLLIGPMHAAKPILFGVRHVLSQFGDKIDVYVGDKNVVTTSISGVRDTVGKSIDPVMTCSVTPSPELSTCTITALSVNEKEIVSYLMVISPRGICRPIKEFKFTRSGDIEAAFDATHGDSGSPIIAVLKTGKLRYAGAISRGTIHDGSPNIIASVLALKLEAGSPGNDNPVFVDTWLSEMNAFQRVQDEFNKDRADLLALKKQTESANRDKRIRDKRKQLVEKYTCALKAIGVHSNAVDDILDHLDDPDPVNFNRIRTQRALLE